MVATRICEEALVAAGEDVELRAEIHAAASRICDHDSERKRSHARAALELTGQGSAGSRLRAYALLAFAEAEFKAGRGILHDVFAEASHLELAEEQADAAKAPNAPTPSTSTPMCVPRIASSASFVSMPTTLDPRVSCSKRSAVR